MVVRDDSKVAWLNGLEKPRRVWLVVDPIASQTRHLGDCSMPQHVKKMDPAVQDDVAALALRLLAASCAIDLCLSWVGDEPLIALDVVEHITEQVRMPSLRFGAGMRATVTTHAHCLIDNRDIVKRLWDSRVRKLVAAVDGDDAWERAEKSLGRCLPFPIEVHVSESIADASEMQALRNCVEKFARESENEIAFLESDDVLPRSAVDSLVVFVDAEGRLYASPEAMNAQRDSFGDAATWDPADPAERDVIVRCMQKGKPMLDRDAELRRITERCTPVFEAWGIVRAWVFGTYAFGEQTPFSDIDMLVELPPGVHVGLRFLDLKRELEEVCGRKVGLRLPFSAQFGDPNSFYKCVDQNKVLVYEADPTTSDTAVG